MKVNQIICGDCLEAMRAMPDKSVDLVLTDPPYGIGVQHKHCVATRKDGRSNEKIIWDKHSPPEEYFYQMRRVGKEQIIWGANYFNCFSDKGGAIVWDKLQPLPDSSQCELASYSRLRKVFKYTQRWTNFVNTKITKHPTEKPVELMRWCLEKFTKESDVILDPFMGSGTIGVACKELGRNFIGIEIEPEYVEIARKRIASVAYQPELDLK